MLYDDDYTLGYLESADESRPLPVCRCRACRSEGFYLSDETCLFYSDGLEDV